MSDGGWAAQRMVRGKAVVAGRRSLTCLWGGWVGRHSVLRVTCPWPGQQPARPARSLRTHLLPVFRSRCHRRGHEVRAASAAAGRGQGACGADGSPSRGRLPTRSLRPSPAPDGLHRAPLRPPRGPPRPPGPGSPPGAWPPGCPWGPPGSRLLPLALGPSSGLPEAVPADLSALVCPAGVCSCIHLSTPVPSAPAKPHTRSFPKTRPPERKEIMK